MIIRIIYGVRMGWRHRHRLKPYRHDSELQTDTILQLDPKKLKADGIKVLAIDFDGVLASHGEEGLEKNIVEWLILSRSVFGPGKIFILSNKPTRNRAELFASHGIELIRPTRKKPYPDGLHHILQRTKVAPEELLLIDDRLLTGILAAKIVGVQAIWVMKPFVNFAKRPLTEIFFVLLRNFERQLLVTSKKQEKRNKRQEASGNRQETSSKKKETNKK